MRDSHNVSKIGLIFSALSKSACGGLVRQVRHFVQPCFVVINMKYFLLQFGPRLSWVYTYFHAVTKRIITLHKNKIVFFIRNTT